MKKILGWIVGLLCVFILLGLILYKVISPSMTMTKGMAVPASFPSLTAVEATVLSDEIANCMLRYASNYGKISSRALDLSSTVPFNTCFSADFLENWDSLGDTIGADPVLFTDAIPSSWLTTVHAKIITKASDKVVFEVVFGESSERKVFQVLTIIRMGKMSISAIQPIGE